MDLNSIVGKQNSKEMWRRGKSISHHQIKFLKNKLIYLMSYSSGIFNLETSLSQKSNLSHAPGSSPYDTGAGSHASCEQARDRRSQTATRGACNRPAVTSTPPSPKPTVERADRHAGGMQPHHGDAPLRLRRIQHGGLGPHVM
jgi:hypothetical protein